MNQYDHLKNRLHQYKVDIDKDKLWENTSHAIPRKKRRGATLIILLAGLLTSGWLMNHSSLIPLSGPKPHVYLNQHANQFHLTQNHQNFSFESASPAFESNISTIDLASSTLITPEINCNQTEKPQISKPASNFIGEDENTLAGASQEADYKRLTEGSSARSYEIESGAGYNSLKIEPPSILGSEQIFSSVTERDGIDLYVMKYVANLPVNFLFNDISFVPLVSHSGVSTKSLKPTITGKKKLFIQSVQFAQSAGLSTMRIRSLNPESDLAAIQLQQKMRSLEILAASATATIALAENFSIVAGIRMSQHSTELNHEWEIEERVQDGGINTIIIDENGIPQSQAGNRDVSRTTHYQAKRFTTHRQTDLILELHRRIWKAGRTSLHAFVKGSYNLSYSARGTTLDQNGELNGFARKENAYHLASPFAIGGGLQINYRVANKWNLIGSMACDQFQYQLSDEFTSVRFRHSGFYVSLGIGHVF